MTCEVCGLRPTSSKYGVCNIGAECRREYQRRYTEANREKHNQRAAESMERYRTNKPEQHKLARKRWRADNLDRERERGRRLYQTYRTRKQSLPCVPYNEQLMYSAQRGRCSLCSEPLEDEWHVEHTIPLSKGGWTVPANLTLAHPSCNLSKQDKLDWNRDAIAVIVAMLEEQPEGYEVTLSHGQFETVKVEQTA